MRYIGVAILATLGAMAVFVGIAQSYSQFTPATHAHVAAVGQPAWQLDG